MNTQPPDEPTEHDAANPHGAEPAAYQPCTSEPTAPEPKTGTDGAEELYHPVQMLEAVLSTADDHEELLYHPAQLLEKILPVAPAPDQDMDPAAIELVERLLRPSARYFRTEIEGIENIPETGALLVSNHGPLGFDATELVFAVYRKTGRMPRGLGERNLFRVPFVKTLLERLGHVAGTRDNAVRILRRGDLALVYPGGAREALKGSETRYQLIWDKAQGFVRVALQAQVPMVPIAGIGVDDYYRVVKEPEETARSLMGRAIMELMGNDKYKFPRFSGIGPLPMPAKLHFIVGEPILPSHPPEAADNPEIVETLRLAMKDRLEQLILTGRIRRQHPLWG